MTCKTYGCNAPVFKEGYCGKCHDKQTLRYQSELTQNKIRYYGSKIKELKKLIFEYEIKIENLK